MSSLPTSMPSIGLSEMKIASLRIMRTWTDEEKLLPPFNDMLPLVWSVCHSPSVPRMEAN